MRGRPREPTVRWSVITANRGRVQLSGSAVRSLRVAMGLTQLELSLQTGISQCGISRLESGKTGRVLLRTAHRLMQAFNVDLGVLAGPK